MAEEFARLKFAADSLDVLLEAELSGNQNGSTRHHNFTSTAAELGTRREAGVGASSLGTWHSPAPNPSFWDAYTIFEANLVSSRRGPMH